MDRDHFIRIRCFTNLDISPSERWPENFVAVPRVGDKIVSETKWGNFQLKLEVVDVTWKLPDNWSYITVPVIELKCPYNMSTLDFNEFYNQKIKGEKNIKFTNYTNILSGLGKLNGYE